VFRNHPIVLCHIARGTHDTQRWPWAKDLNSGASPPHLNVFIAQLKWTMLSGVTIRSGTMRCPARNGSVFNTFD